MVSDEQVRAVCAEALNERDPKRLQNLLEVTRLVCKQYVEERALFLARSKGSAKQGWNAGITKAGKRAA
jgi:hypothetical protein